MAEKWKGFTEEDIKNLTNVQPILKDTKLISASVNKRVSKHSRYCIRKNMAREQILQGLETNDIPEEARLSIPQIIEEEDVEGNNTGNIEGVEDKQISEPLSLRSNDVKTCSNSSKFLSKPILNPDADQVTLFEFETRQKLMEEQNRQRKEKLKKALADRTKKTYEEAQRLSQIEEELKKLDTQLSCDVAILRNEIELASVDFMEAQKRFDRAEREYLDAKLTLFNKKEHKELLIGHLCTIIEQNELRKSNKLSELMDMLDLENIEKKQETSMECKQKGECTAKNKLCK